MIPDVWVRLLYLVAAVLFITGLKQLQSPETARQGNRLSAVGMLMAIVITLLDRQIVGFGTIIAGMIVGSALGFWLAYSVKMTSMPQMVALLNGFGGAPHCWWRSRSSCTRANSASGRRWTWASPRISAC